MNIPVNISLSITIIGDTVYHYIFYALGIGLLVYLFIRYQSRSLVKAKKLLVEKDLAYAEIKRQREELEIKNRNITDSLVYASYIQQAMIPNISTFRKLVPESFIFFKPKEIVSGDFYWASESSGKTFIVAADCTGHGVPGALMSMIGVELLNKIIIDQKIDRASEILFILNQGIRRSFNEAQKGGMKVNDGMDIGLCIIDMKARKLEFSGAFFPLYIIRDNRLIEIKGEKISLGTTDSNLFVDNYVDIEADDMIYMFSDGYVDQFGGPHDKKFMYRRLRHLLLTIHQFSMEEQEAILEESIINWKKDNEQVDDMMIIGMRPVPKNYANR